ncbi:MAG: hypothetical protein R3F59_14420 [Myxococcota bacterium]
MGLAGRGLNCSATGVVVGLALATAVGAAAVVNAFADRFARDRGPGGALGGVRRGGGAAGVAALLAVGLTLRPTPCATVLRWSRAGGAGGALVGAVEVHVV